MRLCPEEEIFLRHWMYDEWNYERGQGPAKRLQLEHEVVPADLALVIAAAMPDATDQEAAAQRRPAEPPVWPWSEDSFRSRLTEARSALGVVWTGDTAEPIRDNDVQKNCDL